MYDMKKHSNNQQIIPLTSGDGIQSQSFENPIDLEILQCQTQI